jgi:hypothetical protein
METVEVESSQAAFARDRLGGRITAVASKVRQGCRAG